MEKDEQASGQNRIECEKYKHVSLTHLSCAVHVIFQSLIFNRKN